MHAIFRYIDDHAQDAVDLLVRLCRQPSISAQRVGLDEMAALMAEVLRENGFRADLHPTCTGVPLVLGELPGAGAERTLLIYNHYDVQPPEPLDQWVTPPFEPAVRDGKLFARGATDNKGNIVSRILAIRALRAAGQGVPVTLKYLIEGEEEISSPGMPDFLSRNRDLLRADGCLWEDTMGRVDAPVVSLGNKGMCKLELRCKVADIDSHSSYAGLYPNAIWRLTWALASLKDRDERILVAGFYDRVRKLSAEEEEVATALPPMDGERLKRVRGLKHLLLDLKDEAIHRRQSLEPTCNISGIEGGYTGAGSKTVLPAEAFARLDMRLVSDQDPEEIATLVRAHLARQGFDDIEVVELGGAYPSRTSVDTPLNRAIAEASRMAYGKEAIFELHQAGSTPQWVIERYLGMPCAATGVGYVTSMTHAPNENIRIDQLIAGAKYMAAIMVAFAAAN
ncbi:MAG: M20/M25/M40 family metallo-hydrolase [Variibacter sp.]|nr:M20/M25/M40 family metallo-hydrolase [Variibacter sp.]